MAVAKKQYVLEGLSCSSCAAKIEKDIGKLTGVSFAAVNFVSKILTVEMEDSLEADDFIANADAIIKRHEPEIIMIEKNSAKPPEKVESTDCERWVRRISFCIGAILFIAAIVFDFAKPIDFIMFLISYILVGSEVVFRALRNISKGQVFDENFLMSIATIGAFAIGEYPEGVAVMLFYQIGEELQRLAVNRSRKSISALMDIKPDYANLKTENGMLRVSPEDVDVGDLIVVKPGEKVPLDGIVTEGFSTLDTSALTGESLPLDVVPKSEVFSGSININGILTVKVMKEYGESTVSQILNLVQNASDKKAPTEKFITKFAKVYTPVVVFAALALAVIPPLLIPDASFSDWIYRALVFLVVSCPCALIISIPLSFFGGIGEASKNGILVKGSNFLDALNEVDTIVFDKTGTLTKGIFRVIKVTGANGWSEQELLSLAAHAESFSNHPIALSIQEAYGKETDVKRVTQQEEIPGLGIRVKIDGRSVLAGNGKLMDAAKIIWQPASDLGSIVYIAVDGVFAGYIVITDELKPDSKETIQDLKDLGIKHTVMLTGDSKAVGDNIAHEIGLDAVYAKLLPNQKVEQLEQIEKSEHSKGKVVFVGDGINDAPVLARADIGIAMGALGADAAIEAADIVLMTDEPSKIVSAIKIARRTRSIALQNIIFAIGVKVIILILAAFGKATIWGAVFGDVGITIIAIFNAMRTMKTVK